jgi:hypothetical protein
VPLGHAWSRARQSGDSATGILADSDSTGMRNAHSPTTGVGPVTCCLPGKLTGPAVPGGGAVFDEGTPRGEVLGGAKRRGRNREAGVTDRV